MVEMKTIGGTKEVAVKDGGKQFGRLTDSDNEKEQLRKALDIIRRNEPKRITLAYLEQKIATEPEGKTCRYLMEIVLKENDSCFKWHFLRTLEMEARVAIVAEKGPEFAALVRGRGAAGITVIATELELFKEYRKEENAGSAVEEIVKLSPP
jgi:hypothetical protein